MTANAAALDAALAQIDRAFGKESAAERVAVKVWMDPFTEEYVRRFIRARVDDYLRADDGEEGALPYGSDMWTEIFDDMDAGDHRVLDHHPFDRMYPPVTLGERIGLFFRRLFGRWQRTQEQIIDREIDRACRRSARGATRPIGSVESPPF